MRGQRLGGGALRALFFLDLCAFDARLHLVFETPRAALTSPAPVPKTCPQAVVSLGSGTSRVAAPPGHVRPASHRGNGSDRIG